MLGAKTSVWTGWPQEKEFQGIRQLMTQPGPVMPVTPRPLYCLFCSVAQGTWKWGMVLKTCLLFLLVKFLQEETALHWLQFKGLGLHFNCGVKNECSRAKLTLPGTETALRRKQGSGFVKRERTHHKASVLFAAIDSSLTIHSLRNTKRCWAILRNVLTQETPYPSTKLNGAWYCLASA